MAQRYTSNRMKLDAMGIALSALCAVHCLLTIVLISSLGVASSWLLAPELHWWGLAAATIIAGVAIGIGAVRHRRRMPFVVAMTGLTFMGGALAAPHGMEEAILTIIGVALVSLGHILNLRRTSDAKPDSLHETR
ncbi:MerC domain-containing protein [Alteriqipengyuania lutimaris]|uniref:MerC domain-containing protein n=2 Tax=Alteriqipengyuania lutimaris TaxID=1538146 RepID=A0A395LMS2_9SPHN|nr:MerC domain-containing protein [Alteriqipengyuania lutimaris]